MLQVTFLWNILAATFKAENRPIVPRNTPLSSCNKIVQFPRSRLEKLRKKISKLPLINGHPSDSSPASIAPPTIPPAPLNLLLPRPFDLAPENYAPLSETPRTYEFPGNEGFPRDVATAGIATGARSPRASRATVQSFRARALRIERS